MRNWARFRAGRVLLPIVVAENGGWLLNSFTNRELAIVIWLGILLVLVLVLALTKKSVRAVLPQGLQVVKTFFQLKILILVALLMLYTAGIVWLLYLTKLWTVRLLKDTIIWFCFTGAVLTFSFLSSHREEKVFSRILSNNVKVIVGLEFLVNTYTFSLPVELILVPLATVVAIMDVFARKEPKHFGLAKLLTVLQVAIGMAVLGVAVVKAVTNFESLLTIDSIRQILLAPALSLLLSPFIYFMLLYTEYELLFIRLGMGFKLDRSVKRYAKLRLIKHLGMNKQRVNAFGRVHTLDLMRIKSREDVDKLLGTRELDRKL